MDWKAIDLLDPEIHSSDERLHALLAWMRESDPRPIISDPEDRVHPFRAITRFQDLLEVEKHPDIFTNTPQSILTHKKDEERSLQQFGQLFPVETLLHMDPPKHTAYRKLTQSWFNPGETKKLTDKIRIIAREHVDRMAAKGFCDFAQDVTTWYPLHVILLILGMPRSDEQFLMQLTRDLMSGDDPDTLAGRSEIDLLERTATFGNYFFNLTQERMAHPTDDLASIIANATIDGQEIPIELKISYYILIVIAGHDTTKYASSTGLLALLQHPDEMRKLRENPSLLPHAVEEMIRWAAPVRTFMRTAQQDYKLDDTLIKKGERLLLLYNSACRDTRAIPDADKFLVDRDPNRHMAFGHGIHLCLGQHLARLEMRILFEELLARFKTIELAGKPEGLQSLFVAGIKKLPIRYS